MINRFPEIVTEVREAADKRPKKPEHPYIGILIHHTGVPKDEPSSWDTYLASMVYWLTAHDKHELSAHFLIGRDAGVVQTVDPDTHVAFHAGKSSFWHPLQRRIVDWCNEHYIGIELIGDGNVMPYTAFQYEQTAKLSAALMRRYRTISPLCVIGHEMVAPGRKNDPGMHFNWHLFYRLLFEEIERLEANELRRL